MAQQWRKGRMSRRAGFRNAFGTNRERPVFLYRQIERSGHALQNALAGVAVKDFDSALAWYERLLNRPADKTPMPGLAEWRFPGGGWLQLFEDGDRAGSSSVTLVENDIESRRLQLSNGGYEIRDESRSDYVAVAVIDDPDGNQIVFAMAASPENESAS